MEEFRPPQSFRPLGMVAATVSLGLIALFASLPWTQEAEAGGGTTTAIVVVSVIGVLFCGALFVLMLLCLRWLPSAGICVDEDGIWRRHNSKEEGLLAWNAMYHARTGFQCLVVTDATGDRRVKIDRNRVGSTRVRERVLDQVARVHGDSPYGTYRKTLSHYAPAVAVYLSMITIGVLTAYNASLPLGCVLVLIAVGLIVYDFLTAPAVLEIAREGITVTSASSAQSIPFTAIRRVKLRDAQNKAYKFPYVELETDDDNDGLTLTQFGIDAPTLYMRLSQALKQAR